MMEKFELTITNQRRVITSLLLFPISILASIFIGIKFNFILGILLFVFILLMLNYFIFGNLIITIQDDVIYFKWQKKLFFNYREIQSLKQSEIEKVIVDNGLFLRKIITKNRTIDLNTSTIKPKDASKLISYFNHRAKTEKSIIKNSWEKIPLKRLRIIYALNSIAIIVSLIIPIFISIFKGFNTKIFFLLGATVMLIMYRQQIKNAIDKKNSNSN